MATVIGVRFRNAGKLYYFDPGQLWPAAGDAVIVETVRGVEYGEVVTGVCQIADELITPPLKKVIRVATAEDAQHEQENRAKEHDALVLCQKKANEHKLQMKLVNCEYTFDNNKILFYFVSDKRVDFRALVKDLAGIFRTRIELRQIGVRDETKMLGGIGICGRELCCCSYLSDFVPVSIKMAKEQNLSLNPTKISGVCGRLMCCLKNEEETYEYLNSRLPGVGDSVITATGQTGEVQSVNVLRQKVKVLIEVDDEKELHEYDVDELKFRPRKKNVKLSAKELEELEGLADEDLGDAENKPAAKPEREAKDVRRDQNRESKERKDHNKERDNKDRENKNREQNQKRNHHNRNRNKDRGKDRADRGDKTNGGGDRQPSESKPS